MATHLGLNLPKSNDCKSIESDQKFEQNQLFCLLKHLFELDWEKSPKAAQHAAKSSSESMLPLLDNDPLWALPQHEAMLKPFLDIIVQNTAGHRGRIGFWRPNSVKPAKNLKKMTESNPMVTLDTVLLGPHVDRLSEEAQKSDLSTKVMSINEKLTDKLNLLCLDSLRFEENPIECLQKLVQLTTDSGFILISEIVKNSQIADLVEKSMNFTPKFRSDSEWKSIFSEAGLRLISSRTDGIMFGMYLLRQNQPQSNKPAVVFCEENREFEWLGELQTQLQTRRGSQDFRVWALAENSTENGLRALARCIKEEDPKRIQIHSIVNTGKEPVKFDLDSEKIQTIFANDLSFNEFQNEEFGTSVFFSVADDEKSTKKLCEHAHLTIQNRGDLSSLQWVESPNKFFQSEVKFFFFLFFQTFPKNYQMKPKLGLI